MAEDREPEQADAVALVLAHLRGDEQAIDALLGMFDVWKLFAVTVDRVLLPVLEQAGVDAAKLEETLVDWQERRRGLP
jgi:hypothetical protein